MAILNIIYSYIHYLIHPFKTHEELKKNQFDFVMRLSAYESLGASWVFIVINGIFRMFIINLILIAIINMLEQSDLDVSLFIDLGQMPAYSFLVLSAVLDVIFYPIFGLFIIQYWEIIIKFFARFLGHTENIDQKTEDIISVSFSSQILKIIPIFGGAISSFANMILMYAGLRVQINSSPILSVLIILSPIFMLAALVALCLLIFLLMI